MYCVAHSSYAQESDVIDNIAANNIDTIRQLRLSFDASKMLTNELYHNQKAFEISIDYYKKKDLYYTIEAGVGSSKVDNQSLKYNTNNAFVRLGFDKSLFKRKASDDWGLGFFGLRYGLNYVMRGKAQYITNDGFGNITNGTISNNNFFIHWFGLCGGMKLELLPHIFAGWTVRAKVMVNAKSSGDLKPIFIAGYGATEKMTAFDYNFFISYAIRWKAKST